MFFHIPYYNPSRYPIERKIWVKVRFLYETNKAILVYYNGKKVWIPKSRIYKIRLRKGVFEVLANERMVNK